MPVTTAGVSADSACHRRLRRRHGPSLTAGNVRRPARDASRSGKAARHCHDAFFPRSPRPRFWRAVFLTAATAVVIAAAWRAVREGEVRAGQCGRCRAELRSDPAGPAPTRPTGAAGLTTARRSTARAGRNRSAGLWPDSSAAARRRSAVQMAGSSAGFRPLVGPAGRSARRPLSTVVAPRGAEE